MGDAPNDYIEEQLEKIVAIEIEIYSIVGQFKTSQNRSTVDVTSAANTLQNQSPEMAESIRKFYPR